MRHLLVDSFVEQAPVGVDAPRLSDLSHWVRTLRSQPTPNFGHSFVSIPTLLLSVPKFSKFCTFKVHNEDGHTYDLRNTISARLAHKYKQKTPPRGGNQLNDVFDHTIFGQTKHGRVFLRKVAGKLSLH